MNETSLSLLDRIRETSDAQSWNRLVALYAPLLKRWVLWYPESFEIASKDSGDHEIWQTFRKLALESACSLGNVARRLTGSIRLGRPTYIRPMCHEEVRVW